MNSKEWFSQQLVTGGNAFIWSANQVPEQRRTSTPPMPDLLGDWTALRHVYHLWNYEHNVALPAMHLWLGKSSHPQENIDAWFNEDQDWKNHSYEVALEMFQQGRAEQVKMLENFNESAWSETRETVWGEVTLHWAVAKTFQHTMEHGSTLMQLALFWDTALAMEQEKSDTK